MSTRTIKTAEALERYAKSLTDKVERSLKEIAEIGVDEIANKRGYTEGGEITVQKQQIAANEYRVSATGKGVYMLEFGAGVHTNSGHPYVSEAEYPIYPGSYSETHAQEYSTNHCWHWNNMLFIGIKSRMGMYYGAERMRKEAKDVFKKVFES